MEAKVAPNDIRTLRCLGKFLRHRNYELCGQVSEEISEMVTYLRKKNLKKVSWVSDILTLGSRQPFFLLSRVPTFRLFSVEEAPVGLC